jgi:hypothetical protein
MKARRTFSTLLVFSALASAQSLPQFRTLYYFQGYVIGFDDGFSPAGLVIGPGGVLYGLTTFGGAPVDQGSA